jgi:hypothetical protein
VLPWGVPFLSPCVRLSGFPLPVSPTPFTPSPVSPTALFDSYCFFPSLIPPPVISETSSRSLYRRSTPLSIPPPSIHYIGPVVLPPPDTISRPRNSRFYNPSTLSIRDPSIEDIRPVLYFHRALPLFWHLHRAWTFGPS